MIANCPPVANPPAIIGKQEHGASQAAEELNGRYRDVFEHYRSPRLQLLVSEIMSLVRSTGVNVGNRDQEPVSHNTAIQASKFVELLPKSLPIPEVAADPDGEISFDWSSQIGSMFSVSIDATGRLAYAGRFGERSKIHGIEQLSESLPREILGGIERAAG